MAHHHNNQQMVQQHQQQQGVRQQPYGIANQPNINHMMQHQPIMVRMPMEDPNAHYQVFLKCLLIKEVVIFDDSTTKCSTARGATTTNGETIHFRDDASSPSARYDAHANGR